MGSCRARRLFVSLLIAFLPLLVASSFVVARPRLAIAPARALPPIADWLASDAPTGATGLASGGVPVEQAQAAALSDDASDTPDTSGASPEPDVDVVQTSPAEPFHANVQTVTRLYDVHGTDLRSVLASVRQLGPHDDQGSWAASTSWTFTWSYHPISEGQCRVAAATVDLTVTHTYPHWATSDPLSSEVTESWSHYLANVETHEHGHGEIAETAASDLVHALQAIPPQTSCDDVARLVNSTAREMLAHHAQAQTTYDRETEHGIAQGATLSLGQ